jgi:hypothetical protein
MENIMQDFKLYLNENEIEINNITQDDISNYISSLHYDILDDVENFEDVELIENDIEQVIYNNFDIKINN